MAFQGISTGSGPNVGDGDTLIAGAIKINSNFSEIYDALGDGTTITSTIIEPDNITTGIITATSINSSGNVTVSTGDVTVSTGDVNVSNGDVNVTGNIDVSGTITGSRFISEVTTGTAPLTVSSTTKVTNLNADLLDGLSSGSFLRSDSSDTSTQRISFQANATNNWDTIATSSGSQGSIEVYNSGSGNDAFMSFHTGGDFALYFGLDADTNDLSVGGWSMGANKYRVWHAGNDGSGSGLDADLLDGLSSGSFLRSDTSDSASGNITFSGAITFSGNTTDLINLSSNSTNDSRGISFNGRTALSADYNDGYLRLNNASEFGNGVYTPGVLRADGGYTIGISDISGSVTPSNARVTRLEFLGEGNDISYNSSTGVVSITIAGTGAGTVEAFPQIGNVTLTEDVTSGARFTGKSFTASYTMTQDSIPASNKNIKGTLVGSFPVYPTGSITGNSIVTSDSGEPAAGLPSNGSYYGSIPGSIPDYFANSTIVCPTPGGAGNGPGYYVHTFVSSYDGGNSGHTSKTSFCPDNPISTNSVPIFEKVSNISYPSRAQGGKDQFAAAAPSSWPMRIAILNDIAWFEYYIDRNPQQVNIGFDECGAWVDSTGEEIVNTGLTGTLWYRNSSITSDGEVVYYLDVGSSTTFSTLKYAYKDPSTGNWLTDTYASFSGKTALVYHKPSSSLIVVSEFSNEWVVYTYSIDTSKSTTGRISFVDSKTQFTSTDTKIKHMAFCGDTGSFLTASENGSDKIYIYSATLKKFTLVNRPDDSKIVGNMVGGDGGDTIYTTATDADGNSSILYRSNDNGQNWTYMNVSTSIQSYLSVPSAPCVGLGQVIYSNYARSKTDDTLLTSTTYVTTNRITQTITISNASAFQNGHRVVKSGFESNPAYAGVLANKSGSSFRLLANESYGTSGTVLNLTDVTTSLTTRYINFDTNGNALSIQSTDPGYVVQGQSPTTIGIQFPTDFAGGQGSPDQEIPVGTSLTIEVQASNTSGSSSDNGSVTPS